MDRRTALDRLECVRSDANDLQDPDFAEALAYLETDEKARRAFARRRELDERIASEMQNVPVPDGLKARLQAVLATENAANPVAPAEEISSPVKSRRWVLSAFVVMASCLLAGLGIWFFNDRPQSLISLEQLEIEAPFEEQEIAKLPRFSGSFEPVKPGGPWMTESRFAFSASPKGFSPSGAKSEEAAVYEFTFRDPQQRQLGNLRGVMLVIPQADLAESPQSRSFFDGTYTIHHSKPNVAIRSWAEGDLVYVCMVPLQHFEALNRVFDDVQAV